MLWDLPNLLVCLIVIMAAYLLGKIKMGHAMILALVSFLPWGLNYVLFNPEYMPDQFTYWHILGSIRHGDYNPHFYNVNVTEASYFYALLPLPFVETINSLGFFNKFLMIIVFIWVAAVLKLRGWILWFLLLYPSLLLYSSLGVREMLICTMMLLAFWGLRKGWYWLLAICILSLWQIKMQNALLVLLFAMVYSCLQFSNLRLHSKKVMVFSVGFLAGFYAFFPLLIKKIDYYRLRMFLEDGGVIADYRPINSLFEFLHQGLLGIFRLFFYPLPWDAQGIWQSMQSLENIGIALLLFLFTWNTYKIIPKHTLMWMFFLLSGMMMNGLVVSNVGTMVRYKLSLIVVYLVFLSYERLLFKEQKKQSFPIVIHHAGN